MMTSSNGNIFRVTGHLCGEFYGPRWIPHTKASDAELWYWVNNGEAGDLRRHRAHYGVAVMFYEYPINVSKPQLLTWKLDSGRFHLQYSQLQWSLWRHQMETFSTLLAICARNSPVSGQWRGAWMFSLIYARINGWVNNGEARLVIWGAVEPIITSL